MHPSRAVVLCLLAIACTPEEKETGVCPWPDAPVIPDGVVSDSCGYFQLDVGDHLYVSVYVSELESPCEYDLGQSLYAADPIYSHMSDDDPKWTWDVVAQVPGNEQNVDISCEDGTTWHALVDVG